MGGSGNGATDPAVAPAPGIRITRVAGDVPGLAVDVDPALSDVELFAAAWLLEAIARETRAMIVAQAAARRPLPVPADVLDQLRKAGRL